MIKSLINLRRVFIFTAAVALTIIYCALWLRMISSPSERTDTDFIAFFTAGQIAGQSGAEHVYEQDLQQQIEAKEVGFALVPGLVLLYNHLPTLIPVLRVVSNDNYVESFTRWCILLVGLILIANGILGSLLCQRGYDTQPMLCAIAGSFYFSPVFTAFLMAKIPLFYCWAQYS